VKKVRTYCAQRSIFARPFHSLAPLSRLFSFVPHSASLHARLAGINVGVSNIPRVTADRPATPLVAVGAFFFPVHAKNVSLAQEVVADCFANYHSARVLPGNLFDASGSMSTDPEIETYLRRLKKVVS